jgi:hypothetical protein
MSKLDLYPNKKSPPSAAQVATCTELPTDKVALDVNILAGSITGSVNINAPTGPFEITVATATAVAANPIAVPLTDRVALSIRNKSATVTVYFGKNGSVTADDTATGGWEIGPGEDFNVDLTDANSFYLITPAATSALVKIMEIAST